MSRKPLHPTTGFTLIELMVSVALIAILISILLSALGKARHNARTAICLSNQGNIGDDIAVFAADHNGLFPWLTTGGHWFHTEVLACPADEKPVMMPWQAMGTDADVAVSYGFNPEYALFKVPLERIRNPSASLTLYDGFGNDGNNGSTLPGGASNSYFISGNKMTVTHLPPGNNANPQVTSISVNALDGHVGHNHPDSTHVDLIGNWVINGRIDIPTYTRGDFLRRHPIGNHVGNVAFADGHAVSVQQLDATWYVFPN